MGSEAGDHAPHIAVQTCGASATRQIRESEFPRDRKALPKVRQLASHLNLEPQVRALLWLSRPPGVASSQLCGLAALALTSGAVSGAWFCTNTSQARAPGAAMTQGLRPPGGKRKVLSL